MRYHEFFFGLIRIPLEILIVGGAFLIARTIRISTDLIPGIQLPLHSIDPLYLLAVASVSYVVIGAIFAFQRLYAIHRTIGAIEEIFVITKSLFVAFFIVIGLIYLSNGFPYQTILIPRLILFYAFLITLIGIIGERILLRYLRGVWLRSGWIQPHMTLLVMNQSEPEIIEIVTRDPTIKIAGYIAPHEAETPLSYLGALEGHASIIVDYSIEEVILLAHDLPYALRRALFDHCRIHGIRYRYIGNLYESIKNNTHIDFIGHLPFIEIRTIRITPWGRVLKRTFDIALSLTLTILFMPFCVIIAVMIMLDSPGGPFYVSHRVGRGGRIIHVYKFRSMVREADRLKATLMADNERADGPLFKLDHDPRVTRLGQFLRRWSIDELPQILNVLTGSMSFIGPRPHLPEEVAKYSPDQRQVLTIKPGITGMAQVNGRHTNTFEREIAFDLFYIENWSLLLDIRILLLTLRAIFRGR